MSFAVYDFHTDIRNILVTPQIRSRFLRLEPGQVAQAHSHDLGHEIFLILQGEAEFTIEGAARVVRPGQLCVALTDQIHQVKVIGDTPVIMYLSVTPHIQPTHTFWTVGGQKQPPRFAPDSAYDVIPDPSTTTDQLMDTHLNNVEAIAVAVQAFVTSQCAQTGYLKKAVAEGDIDAARRARAAMWETLYPTFQALYAMGANWNALAAALETTPGSG